MSVRHVVYADMQREPPPGPTATRQVNSVGFLCLRGAALAPPHFPARLPRNGTCSSRDHSLPNVQASVLFIGFADGGQPLVNDLSTEPDEAEPFATFPGDEPRLSPERMEDQNRPSVMAELDAAHLTASFPADDITLLSANQRPNQMPVIPTRSSPAACSRCRT